jgi:putative phosphoribosyl transferase
LATENSFEGPTDTDSQRASYTRNGLPGGGRFADLGTAGRDLAAALVGSFNCAEDTVVVAIARGGVPVALEVAKHFRWPLDIVLIRRLLTPGGPGSQVCAVNACGRLVIDDKLPITSSPPNTALECFIADALEGLALRERVCRSGRAVFDVARRNVLLIDNGIHTGATALATIQALRTLKPARLTVAVPVAAPSSRALIERAADDLICLAWPEPFGHAGLWYAKFNVPQDEQIHEMLDQTPLAQF